MAKLGSVLPSTQFFVYAWLMAGGRASLYELRSINAKRVDFWPTFSSVLSLFWIIFHLFQYTIFRLLETALPLFRKRYKSQENGSG